MFMMSLGYVCDVTMMFVMSLIYVCDVTVMPVHKKYFIFLNYNFRKGFILLSLLYAPFQLGVRRCKPPDNFYFCAILEPYRAHLEVVYWS